MLSPPPVGRGVSVPVLGGTMRRLRVAVGSSVPRLAPTERAASTPVSPSTAPSAPSADERENNKATTTEGQTLAVDELVVRAETLERLTDDRQRPRPARWFALLTAGFLVQFAWRLYLAWPLVGPVAHADEDGYLLAARVLGGGANAYLPGWSIMRPIGYPLLLSPIHWFVDQPAEVYKGVHVINAILTALIFPLLYALARRMFDIARWPAAAIAFVLATLPSAVFFGEFALTDAFLPSVVLLLLLAIHGTFSATGRTAVRWGALSGLIAGYAANTHVRGLVMLVVLGALVVLAVLRKWITWPTAIATGATAGVVYGLGKLANNWLESRMFANGSFAVGERIFDRLTSFNGVVGVAVDALGQIWHLSTSTWGFGAFGLVAAVFALVRREGPRANRIVLAVALAVTVFIAGATATGIPYETEKRINNHVYGRYVAILATFWVLVGVVALLRASARRATQMAVASAALVAVTIGVVVVYWGSAMRTGSYVNFDSPELSYLTNDFRHLHYFEVTLIVMALIAFFGYVLPQRPRLVRIGASWWKNRAGVSMIAAATLAAVMVFNLAGMVRITHHISQVWVNRDYHAGTPDLVRDAGVRPGDSVIQANSVSWMMVLRHQHEVYWEPLPTFDPVNGAPPGHPEWVVASTGTGKPTDWYGWNYGYKEVLRFPDGYAGTCVVWKAISP